VQQVNIKYVYKSTSDDNSNNIHKSRCGNPVHKSHFNPADRADVISVRILGTRGAKTFHIYEDGMATSSMYER
jgi:hypothetical protein